MLGIERVAAYVPPGRIDCMQAAQRFQVDREFLETKTGMTSLAVKEAGQSTTDLCVAAWNQLFPNPDDGQTVDCLIVCTQNPDGTGLPHTSARVHHQLNLPTSCAVFDISLGCSGFVYGLYVLQGFMLAAGYQRGVLITADPYSGIVDPNDKNTSLLFGDAAAATLVSNTPVWSIGKAVFGSQGAGYESIQVKSPGESLELNGRAVFEFAARTVPENILATIAANSLTMDSVDLLLVHQGSRHIVETIRRRLQLPPEKIPFHATGYGNTVSSSLPIMLADLPEASPLKTILLSGFGVGLSWGSLILKRVERSAE